MGDLADASARGLDPNPVAVADAKLPAVVDVQEGHRVGVHRAHAVAGGTHLRVVLRADAARGGKAEWVALGQLRRGERRFRHLAVEGQRVVVQVLEDRRHQLGLARRGGEAAGLAVLQLVAVLEVRGLLGLVDAHGHGLLVVEVGHPLHAMGADFLVGLPRPVLFLAEADGDLAEELVVGAALAHRLGTAVAGDDEVVGVLAGGQRGALHPVGAGEDVVGDGGCRGLPELHHYQQLQLLEVVIDPLDIRRPGQRVGFPADSRGHRIGVVVLDSLPGHRRRAE